MSAPSDVPSSSPTGRSSEVTVRATSIISLTCSTGRSAPAAISSGVGSRPSLGARGRSVGGGGGRPAVDLPLARLAREAGAGGDLLRRGLAAQLGRQLALDGGDLPL